LPLVALDLVLGIFLYGRRTSFFVNFSEVTDLIPELKKKFEFSKVTYILHSLY